MPRRMLRALSSPACTARVGPSRSAVSAPFSKSNTSLAKLAPIWSSSAPASAASAGPHFTSPRADAQAVPTSTGAAAALSVFGRLASSQAATEPGRTPAWGDVLIGTVALIARLGLAFCSRQALELLEVGFALLEERLFALFAFFRHVE